MGQHLTSELESKELDRGQQQSKAPERDREAGATRETDPRSRQNRCHDHISSINSSWRTEQEQGDSVGDRMLDAFKDEIQRLAPSVLMEAMMETLAGKLLERRSVLLSPEPHQEDLIVSVFKGKYFQLGEFTQTDCSIATIYTKIGPWEHAGRALPKNLKTNQLRISASLTVRGNEFCNREFLFVLPPGLELKLPVRTNESNLQKFLEAFSMQIQILHVAQPSEPLISFEIPYKTLLEQKASLLMKQFSIRNDPAAHTLDCLICLENEPLPVSGPSRAIKYSRSTSNEDNYLTKMTEELKSSPKLVDLTLEKSLETSKTASTTDLDDPMQPTDLRVIKRSTTETETSSLKALDAVSPKKFTDMAIQSTPSSSHAATQTVLSIQSRKHVGPSGEVNLGNKIANYAATSLDPATITPTATTPSKISEVMKPTAGGIVYKTITTPRLNDPPEPEQTPKTSTGPGLSNPPKPEQSPKKVTKPGLSDPPKPEQTPKTVIVLRKKPVATRSATACTETQYSFKCSEKGCSGEFRNAGALRRHRRYEHKK